MAIKAFNSVAGFSVGETPANIILSNGFITTTGATFTANIAALGVLTDNLYYANGVPWDLQEPAGSNTQVQFNDDQQFGASTNFTFDTDTANLDVSGNINLTTGKYYGDGSQLTGIDSSGIANGTSNVRIPAADGNIELNSGGNLVANITDTGANVTGTLNVSGIITVPSTSGAIDIALGTPTQGSLTSNALTLTTASSVSNSIAQLNTVLGKLVPASPADFPGSYTLAVDSLSTYRMTNFTQTDNTGTGGKSVAGGTTVNNTRRSASYTTNAITNVGPGDSGTITALLNNVNAGQRILTTALDGNGTYSNLIISNNVDYNAVDSSIAEGFWSVFTADTSGTVTEGWNEIQIDDSVTSATGTPDWYYDASTPGTPQFSSVSFTADSTPSYTYSSTVNHYNNTNVFTIDFDVNRLSGDMYPTSDTFITGSSGGAFSSPASRTYTNAGVTQPLARDLHVASGAATVATTATVISGFGSSASGPSVNAFNSYATGVQSFTPSGTVLYKTGTSSSSSRIEEANVYIGSTVGTGGGLAFRIENPGSSDTPAFSASASAFDSQNGPLQTYDATVVADSLAHNVTDYTTGFLPVGPDLSGQGASQYFTFKVIRTSVSKFDVKWSGTLAGLWVCVPGSAIDNASGLNGWVDMSASYGGAGVPGSDIGNGGNGSDGCALGTTAPLNASQTNTSITATFGTVSTSSTATNEIYIRIKLTSGQSISALTLESASN
tara:strand:- start:579 stop:2750 length:2172 start_codon:yes stop_codon:yes gene_type:complete